MIEETIMSWNCRGAGSREFVREMKEMVKEHMPPNIVLMEPRISGDTADDVCMRLGKNKQIQFEAFRFSDGLWILWDDEAIDLRLRQADRFFLHLGVRTLGD